MKRILFWLIIGTTVLATLVYSGITTVTRKLRRKKEDRKSEQVSGLMRDARYAMIK